MLSDNEKIKAVEQKLDGVEPGITIRTASMAGHAYLVGSIWCI
jgi:hypothetical protein